MNFVHGTMGAGVAVLVVFWGGPLWLGLSLAFVFHFVMDAIPHWDPVWPWPPGWKRIWPTLVDFLGMGMILGLMFGWGWILEPVIFWGMIFGILPDVMLGISGILKQKTWVEKIHEKVQEWSKPSFWIGFGGQVLVVMLMVLILRWVGIFG